LPKTTTKNHTLHTPRKRKKKENEKQTNEENGKRKGRKAAPPKPRGRSTKYTFTPFPCQNSPVLSKKWGKTTMFVELLAKRCIAPYERSGGDLHRGVAEMEGMTMNR
jgi:hypothetical protein